MVAPRPDQDNSSAAKASVERPCEQSSPRLRWCKATHHRRRILETQSVSRGLCITGCNRKHFRFHDVRLCRTSREGVFSEVGQSSLALSTPCWARPRPQRVVRPMGRSRCFFAYLPAVFCQPHAIIAHQLANSILAHLVVYKRGDNSFLQERSTRLKREVC